MAAGFTRSRNDDVAGIHQDAVLELPIQRQVDRGARLQSAVRHPAAVCEW